jgi:hypothetical protein
MNVAKDEADQFIHVGATQERNLHLPQDPAPEWEIKVPELWKRKQQKKN